MKKRNYFLLLSTLLNFLLIFILVGKLKTPLVEELSEDKNYTLSKETINENSGEVIGEETQNTSDYAKVIKVIDGDTVVLDTGQVVRYIGVDTPESSQGRECFAKEATEKNKELVLGKKVRLEKDVSETDRYKRLLRYVYLDNIFINEILVYDGYATASTYPPDVKYADLFRQAEKYARENKKGLWGECVEKVSEAPKVPQVSKEDNQQVISNQLSFDCESNLYNCTDFKNHAEAQAAFEACGGTSNDIHKLDFDGDGNACESLP